jgi:hypothetical protein
MAAGHRDATPYHLRHGEAAVPFGLNEYRRDIKKLMLRANRSRADARLISIALRDAARKAEQLRGQAAQPGAGELFPAAGPSGQRDAPTQNPA